MKKNSPQIFLIKYLYYTNMNTPTNQQQNQQPNGNTSGAQAPGNTSGAQAPGNISPEVLQQAYQHALSTLISDPNFARQLAASIRVADFESKQELDATQLRNKKYGFSHVSSNNLFEKEWKVEHFTGLSVLPSNTHSQHFKDVNRSKTNVQITEVDDNYLQSQYQNIANKNVIWFDDTDDLLYIRTNDNNCPKRRAYILPNAQVCKLGLPTFSDIVSPENAAYLSSGLLNGVKTFRIGGYHNPDFLLFYTEGVRNQIANIISRNQNTQFSAYYLYGMMAIPAFYQSRFEKKPINEKKNSFMPVQYFLMYLNSVNGHIRLGDKVQNGYRTVVHEKFIPEIDELLKLIKTLVVNFNVNRERSIPHNLQYFDCDGATNEEDLKEWNDYWYKQNKIKDDAINKAITVWSTCTPAGPIDMFGQIVDGSGSATVPGYGSSPFGKAGGMADSIGQLSFY